MTEPMTPERLDEIRARIAAATPGPWQWFGNLNARDIYLATTHSGRRYVMRFDRWGMNGAQPTFQVNSVMVPLSRMDTPHKSYSGELVDGIGHPDAQLMAHAPTDLAALVAEVERLTLLLDVAEEDERRMDRLNDAWQTWDVHAIHALGLDSQCPDFRDAVDQMEAP